MGKSEFKETKMAEENEIRKIDTTESFSGHEQELNEAEQHEIDFAKAHPERIPLTETKHNPDLTIPKDLEPIAESKMGDRVVEVPDVTEDPFSEAELMGKKKTAEELALEHLIEHGLALDSAHDTQDKILDLSQHQE